MGKRVNFKMLFRSLAVRFVTKKHYLQLSWKLSGIFLSKCVCTLGSYNMDHFCTHMDIVVSGSSSTLKQLLKKIEFNF